MKCMFLVLLLLPDAFQQDALRHVHDDDATQEQPNSAVLVL